MKTKMFVIDERKIGKSAAAAARRLSADNNAAAEGKAINRKERVLSSDKLKKKLKEI